MGAVDVAQGLAPVFKYEGLDETAVLALGAVEVAQGLVPVFKYEGLDETAVLV